MAESLREEATDAAVADVPAAHVTQRPLQWFCEKACSVVLSYLRRRFFRCAMTRTARHLGTEVTNSTANAHVIDLFQDNSY